MVTNGESVAVCVCVCVMGFVEALSGVVAVGDMRTVVSPNWSPVCVCEREGGG